MRHQIKFEYRKLWNKITFTAVLAMFVISTLHTFIYLNLQWRTIDQNEKIISGIPSYRALEQASRDLEGYVDGSYIKKLIQEYDASYDKKYLAEHRGFLGTGGMTKFMKSNYLINYAYYGPYMSNGNDKIGLDYDFLSSEKAFYQKYKAAMKEEILAVNEWNGLIPYTKDQIKVLDKKIQNIKTPFYSAYTLGLDNMINWFDMEYPFFFIVLIFSLAGLFARDSTVGINEFSLSAANGRKKNFRARLIAGNLLLVTEYLIFLFTIIIEHGIVASFHGWNASAQLFWYDCLYQINMGTGMSIMFAGGLLGAAVAGNLVMLLSIKIRKIKIILVSAVVLVWLINRQAETYSQIKLLNPIEFRTESLLKTNFFVGNMMIPYFVIVIILALIYVAVLQLLIRTSYKKYFLG